jgi:hypothetical protein
VAASKDYSKNVLQQEKHKDFYLLIFPTDGMTASLPAIYRNQLHAEQFF